MTNKVALKSIAVLTQKIANTPVVLHFKDKHPNTFQFIAKRISLNKFSGLPLLILSISIILNLFLLFDFTEETINSKEFIAIDSFIAKLFFNIRSEFLARGFYIIS